MVGRGVATILFTDQVGSTRLRELIGDDGADKIGREHDRIVADAVTSAGGRIVKNLGDGALVVFDSSVDAITAAQRILEGVNVYNRDISEAHRLKLRIGINAGELVTGEDGDVSGLPVAVASRVCEIAGASQIVVTGVVRSLVGRRAKFGFQPLGPYQLKGVVEPVELWTVGAAVVAETQSAETVIPFPEFLRRGVPRLLVGREKQAAAIETAYGAATDGVRFAVVIGEPGIGKTALVSTWCREAVERGATIVGGRCTPDAALPYQPFIEIARAVLGARPGLIADLGPASGNVAQLVPGVVTQVTLPPPVQADPDTTRYLMAEAFARLLRADAAGLPVVVVLDDLHWADEHSLGVVAHLARYADDLALLLIGTYRDTDLVRNHPLPQLLTDLRRERRLVRIPVPRLTESEVGELIAARFGAEAPEAVVDSISEETQGNPFFIEEITMHLEDEGAIDAHGQWISEVPIEEYGIPEGVRDVVGRRLDRLGDNANAVLEVAAVIGPTFSIDVAGSIAGLDEGQIDEVVISVVSAGIFEEGTGPEEFVFTHALIRQTLYDGLATRRRTRLHRAVGEVFESRGSHPGVVLHHWLHANDPTRALAATVDAASSAQRTSAGIDVLAYLELALDLWDDATDPEGTVGSSHADLVLRVLDSYSDFGDPRGLAISLVEAEIARVSPTDTATLSLLHSALAGQYWVKGRNGDALAAHLEALRLIPDDSPSEELAQVLGSYAAHLMLAGDLDEAIRIGERALAVASALGIAHDTADISRAGAARSRAVGALATAYGNRGDIDTSDRYFDELRQEAQNNGDSRSLLLGYTNQGTVCGVTGKLTKYLQMSDEGATVAAELGRDRWQAILLTNAFEALFGLSRWDEAEDRLRAVPPADTRDKPELARVMSVLILAVERGDGELADGAWEELARVDISDLDPEIRGPSWAARLSQHRWGGDLAAGYDVALEALPLLGDTNCWSAAALLAGSAIELVADALESGAGDATWLEAARSWHDMFVRNNPPALFSAELWATATADLARAGGENDPELWRKAVRAWGGQGYYEAKAKWRLAQALAETDPAHADIGPLLDSAAVVADRLRARPLSEAIHQARP